MTQQVPPGPISEFFKGLLVGVFENVEKREQERESMHGAVAPYSASATGPGCAVR